MIKYNFWDIDVKCDSLGRIWKNKKEPILISSIEIDSDYFTWMQENAQDTLVYNFEWMDKFELDKTYYVMNEEKTEFWIFSIHKGYIYYDTAEHDDRVKIAVAFNLTKEQAHIL